MRKLKYVNFEKILAFSIEAFKNQSFSRCTETLMLYITFLVHGHVQELIREVLVVVFNSTPMPPCLAKKVKEQIKPKDR